MNNPEKFSRIPWSKKNYEIARREFLGEFFDINVNEQVLNDQHSITYLYTFNYYNKKIS